jgi:hypothetical protein
MFEVRLLDRGCGQVLWRIVQLLMYSTGNSYGWHQMASLMNLVQHVCWLVQHRSLNLSSGLASM